MTSDRTIYRRTIDQLVDECHDGQGQVAARRVRAGLWNPNADQFADEMPDQVAYNDLLRRLSPEDRDTLAGLIADEFVGGVHETLRVLHDFQLEPFDDGYEGSPHHDFVGRLNGWEWPADR